MPNAELPRTVCQEIAGAKQFSLREPDAFVIH